MDVVDEDVGLPEALLPCIHAAAALPRGMENGDEC